MENIFIYEVFIDDDENTGVDKVSLVKRPAIMVDFVYMSEQLEAYKQIHLQEEKRILTGPALIPDLEIIRKDEGDEPYYIKYNADQIEQIVQKFFREKDQFSVNKDHKSDVNGIFIYESWITGEKDKAKDLGFDVPAGTWMISMKIDNDEIWEGVKAGKYRGFSIEGLFKFKKSGSKLTFSNIEEDYFELKDEDHLKILDLAAQSGYRTKEEAKNILTKSPRVFYKYAGPIVANSRDFCREMISLDRFYTREDVDNMNSMALNPGFGPEGSDTYNILLFKGGANCHHHWDKYWMWLENDKVMLKYGGQIAGRAGQDPYTMDNHGYKTKQGVIEIQQIKPESGEDESTFIGRCMSELKGEFPDEKQRLAVCYSYWTEQSANEKISEAMVSMILKDGNTLYTDGDMFDVGVEVYFLNGEEKVPVDAGEYEAEDGSIIVVGDGSVIAEIRPVEAPAPEDETPVAETALTLDAIKEYLDPIFNKLTEILTNMSEVKQSVIEVETKMEKILVDNEMKSVKTIDEKKVEQSKHSKLDYELIRKYNKKF